MEALIPNPVDMVIQVAIFFATYFVLRTFVFGPYLELLDKRFAKTEGLKQKAQAQLNEAEHTKEKYLKFISAERKKIHEWVEGERQKIATEEKKIITEARDQVSAELDSKRANLSEQVGSIRGQLMKEVPEFASQIASKLVGKTITINSVSLEHSEKKTLERALRT